MLGVRGSFPVTMDAKGRISLPAKLRERLRAREDGLLVFTSFKGRIWGYTEDVWEKYEAWVMEDSPFEENTMLFSQAFMADAADCPIDKQGRILLPPGLREYGGLERELIIANLPDHIEIWSADRWQEHRQRVMEQVDRAGGLDGLFTRRREQRGG